MYVFYLSLALAFLAVLIPLHYLRPPIRRVLLSVCQDNDAGAAFWLRATDVLAFSGSIILVLLFGRTDGPLVEAVRLTLILALAGVFVTVLFVMSNVWRVAVSPALGASSTAPAAEAEQTQAWRT